MGKPLRCRLGKHEWRLRKGRFQEWDAEEQTYYWCPTVGIIASSSGRSGAPLRPPVRTRPAAGGWT